MAGSLTGLVTNQQDGQPLAGASLNLSGTATEQTASGSDGSFAFESLAAGSYELVVQLEGFEPGIYGPLVVIDGMPTDLNLALPPKDLYG